jgi:hypothetical protein
MSGEPLTPKQGQQALDAAVSMTKVADKAFRTIEVLVGLIDQLRQPYNNSKRSDLYWLATNAVNKLEEDHGILLSLDGIPTTPPGWPTTEEV